jgi:hypothetical protein
MARNSAPNLIAGGDINPMTFVQLSAVHDNTGLAGTANAACIAISQAGTKYPAGVLGSTAVAANAGDNLELFGLGDICNLVAGTGGFTAGDPIKSDANAAGVTATVAGTDVVCAFALETTTIGLYGRVQICTPHKL